MGAPIFKWKNFCKHHNITILSSNYPLYGDMSARVMTILEQFTPNVEVYSIDEAFIDLTGFDQRNFNEYGKSIRQRILKWTGIPTCVGIAPTKALCKVANKIARKFPKEVSHCSWSSWIRIRPSWTSESSLLAVISQRPCL